MFRFNGIITFIYFFTRGNYLTNLVFALLFRLFVVVSDFSHRLEKVNYLQGVNNFSSKYIKLMSE